MSPCPPPPHLASCPLDALGMCLSLLSGHCLYIHLFVEASVHSYTFIHLGWLELSTSYVHPSTASVFCHC